MSGAWEAEFAGALLFRLVAGRMSRGAINNATERPLLRAARELASLHGWLHYHAPQCQHARTSEPGFPDLLLVRAPLLLAVEIKAPREKPRAEQLRWLQELSGVRAAEAYVLRPGPSLDELEGLLR